MLKLIDKINKQIEALEENKKSNLEKMLEELFYSFMDYSKKSNEIYYKAGFGDCLDIVMKTLDD